MISFIVKPDDGEEYELTAGSRDVLTFERATKVAFSALMESLHMAHLYKIAHIAAMRQGMFQGSLQDFEQSVELDQVKQDDEPDPTQPDH